MEQEDSEILLNFSLQKSNSLMPWENQDYLQDPSAVFQSKSAQDFPFFIPLKLKPQQYSFKNEQQLLQTSWNQQIPDQDNSYISVKNTQNFDCFKRKTIQESREQYKRVSCTIYPELYKKAQVYNAFIHYHASLFKKSLENHQEKCECCGQPILGQLFPLNCPIQQLCPLGASVPLFFELIKQLIIILSLVFIVLMISSIWVLYESDSLNIEALLYPGMTGELNQNVFWTHLLGMSVFFGSSLVMRRMMNKLGAKYSIFYQNISSYSVMLQNINLQTTELDIKQHFDCLNVKKVAFTYNIQKILKLSKKYDKAMKIYIKMLSGETFRKGCKEFSLFLQSLIVERIEAQLISLVTQFDYRKFTNIVFVTFQTKLQAQIAYQNSKNKKLCCKNESSFKVQKAADPDQLFWENFSIPKVKKYILISLHYFLGVLLTLIIGSAVFYLRMLLMTDLQVQEGLELYIYETLISSLILLMQSLFTFYVYKKAVLEHYNTLSGYKLSVAFQILVLLMINSGLLIMLLVYLRGPEQWERSDGYANQVLVMLVINSFLVPIYQLFPISDLLCLFRRKYYLKVSSQKVFKMSQVELNQRFEPPQMYIEAMYGQIMKVFFISVLFIVVIPIGIPITILGLGLFYWAMKYKLLRINKKPRRTSEEIGLNMSFLTYFGLFFYGLGVSLVYQQIVVDELISRTSKVVFCVILLISLSFPLIEKYTGLNLKDLIKIYGNQKQTYSMLACVSPEDYTSENPMEKLKPKQNQKDYSTDILDYFVKLNTKRRSVFYNNDYMNPFKVQNPDFRVQNYIRSTTLEPFNVNLAN